MTASLSCPRGRALALIALVASGCVSLTQEHATTRANVHAPGDQDAAAVAALPGGGYIVAWESRRQDAGTSGVYARAFDRDGVPTSPEHRVNAWSPGAQRSIALDAFPDGSAIAAWTSQGQDGPGRAVVARRLNAGLDDASPEIVIAPSLDADQYRPCVAAHDSGVALMSWTGPGPSARGALIMPDDTLVRLELSAGERADHAVLAPSADGFIAAWVVTDADGGPGPLRARFVSLDGTPSSAIALETGPAIEPAIDADERAIALAWLAPTRDGYAARARLFDHAGTPLTPILAVSDDGSASGASIALDAHRVLVAAAVEGDDPAGPESLLLLRFDRAGRGVDLDRLAQGAAPLARASVSRRLVIHEDRVAIAWSGDAGLGDSRGVNLTILGAPGRVARAPSRLDRAELAEPIEPPSFDPDRVMPRVPRSVDGVGRDGAFPTLQSTGWTPPDMDLAVGPDRLVTVVNVAIAVFDKQGALLWSNVLDASGEPGFFEEAGAAGLIFDAECHWDPHHDRFWVMANERHLGRGYFLVAVSRTADPLDGWHRYRLDVTDAAGGGIIDSPNLAISADVLTLSADFFDDAGAPEHLVYMLDPAPLLAGDPPGPATWIHHKGIQSLGLAPTFENNPPAQYLLRSTEDEINSTVVLHAITDPLGTPVEHEFTIPVPAYRFPGQPRQKGTSVKFNLFEPRFWSCLHRKNSIWAVHHLRPEGSDRTVIRWYRIRTNGWPRGSREPELVQWGQIDAGPDADAFFPSIGVDDEGSFAITYARSGINEYPSMWRALRRHDDPAGETRTPELVKDSAAPYTEAGRFGDYCKTQHDESAPGIFWGIHEYVNENGAWGTFVGRYVNTCDADLNRDGAVDVFDFLEFQTRFTAGDMSADVDGNGALNLFDYLAYQAAVGAC